MDAIGSIQAAVVPTLPAPSSQSAPLLPKPSSVDMPLPKQDSTYVDAQVQAMEQRRFEAVQRMAQDIANVFIVSDRTFTIYKDTTGQYITRFTSLRDGKVTYIPEPDLIKLSRASTSATLTISA
jgi:hypothetical protein